MQFCSLGQGTVSPWSIVPRCPRVLQVLPTMSDSSQVSQLLQSQLSDIVGSTCNTLGQCATMLHGDTVPCPMVQSCIVWTDLKSKSVIDLSASSSFYLFSLTLFILNSFFIVFQDIYSLRQARFVYRLMVAMLI